MPKSANTLRRSGHARQGAKSLQHVSRCACRCRSQRGQGAGSSRRPVRDHDAAQAAQQRLEEALRRKPGAAKARGSRPGHNGARQEDRRDLQPASADCAWRTVVAGEAQPSRSSKPSTAQAAGPRRDCATSSTTRRPRLRSGGGDHDHCRRAAVTRPRRRLRRVASIGTDPPPRGRGARLSAVSRTRPRAGSRPPCRRPFWTGHRRRPPRTLATWHLARAFIDHEVGHAVAGRRLPAACRGLADERRS